MRLSGIPLPLRTCHNQKWHGDTWEPLTYATAFNNARQSNWEKLQGSFAAAFPGLACAEPERIGGAYLMSNESSKHHYKCAHWVLTSLIVWEELILPSPVMVQVTSPVHSSTALAGTFGEGKVSQSQDTTPPLSLHELCMLPPCLLLPTMHRAPPHSPAWAH